MKVNLILFLDISWHPWRWLVVFQEAIKQSCYKVNRRCEKVLLGTILLPWWSGYPLFLPQKKIRIDKRKKDLPNANAYQTLILQFIYALEIPMRLVYYKMPHYNVSLAQLSHFLCYAYHTNSLTFLHFAITLKYPHHISTQDEKMRMVPHTYNTNNLETEAGESLQFQEQLELHTSLKANWTIEWHLVSKKVYKKEAL